MSYITKHVHRQHKIIRHILFSFNLSFCLTSLLYRQQGLSVHEIGLQLITKPPSREYYATFKLLHTMVFFSFWLLPILFKPILMQIKQHNLLWIQSHFMKLPQTTQCCSLMHRNRISHAYKLHCLTHFLSRLLNNLDIFLHQPPILGCDNIGVTYLSVNPLFHACTRHVAIHCLLCLGGC